MEIFRLTTRFPKEERYALVDQMRRSSRGVCGNIVEGFAKRRHEAVFKNSLNDSLGESEETKPCPEPVEGSGWISPSIASMLHPTSTRGSPLATGKSALCCGPSAPLNPPKVGGEGGGGNGLTPRIGGVGGQTPPRIGGSGGPIRNPLPHRGRRGGKTTFAGQSSPDGPLQRSIPAHVQVIYPIREICVICGGRWGATAGAMRRSTFRWRCVWGGMRNCHPFPIFLGGERRGMRWTGRRS
jgi:four helix bundle protein